MKKYLVIVFLSVLFVTTAGIVRAEKVNNYLSGAFVKTFTENKFDGDYKNVVVKVTIEVDNNIYQTRRENVLLAIDTYQFLEDAFVSRGWRPIDYYTNKPESGRLFITFDPRNRGIAVFTEIEVKEFKNNIKKREDNINRYYKEIVEETELRLREEHRLK